MADSSLQCCYVWHGIVQVWFKNIFFQKYSFPKFYIVLLNFLGIGPNISDDRIPKEPPFTAYLANLSYDINPEDVYDFFGKLKINNVRLLRDGDQETGRLKG